MTHSFDTKVRVADGCIMLPGSNRPCVLPNNYSPPSVGIVDVNLAVHLMEKFGNLNHSSVSRIRSMNFHLLDLKILEMWNGCNGFHVDLLSELSLDATPRNHYFVNTTIPKALSKRKHVSIQRYFEEKYAISLNQPHSPLLRDLAGRLYPIEAIWLRVVLF
ncbi:hypothetical protein CAEBREN_02255 [Caenorhabditis brenneri]|uniref:Uncharacterized protein n=1 Tax=Caenorhabditis brenneri TaxID=135651 RepID=G0MAL2_CAEBE|nr:hypothetical protein CAEBREN_02255 [Caenorhabditis brenneri]